MAPMAMGIRVHHGANETRKRFTSKINTAGKIIFSSAMPKRGPTINFDERKKCYTDTAGRAYKGGTRRYKRGDYNTAGCAEAKEIGVITMLDIEHHVNSGTPLQTPGGKRIISYLRFRRITPLKAEFPVCSQVGSVRTGTGVDLVCDNGGNRHFLIEIKCTTAPNFIWMNTIRNKIDTTIPRLFYQHFQKWMDNTRWNTFTNQAMENMDYYGNTLKGSVFKPGDKIYGALLICFEADQESPVKSDTGIHWEDVCVTYNPDSGANTIRPDIREKREQKAAEKKEGILKPRCGRGVSKPRTMPTRKIITDQGVPLVMMKRRTARR